MSEQEGSGRNEQDEIAVILRRQTGGLQSPGMKRLSRLADRMQTIEWTLLRKEARGQAESEPGASE